MKKRIITYCIIATCFGFGIIPEAISEEPDQELPCWKKKGSVSEAFSFLYCPWAIFSNPCDYVDGWYPKDGSERKCEFETNNEE